MIAAVPRDFEEAYINQHISLARPISGFNAQYLAWYLAARPGQKQFLELQRGATKVGLGLEDVRSVNVPMPPLAEQMQIVSEIESRFSVVAALDSQLTDGFQRVKRLRQSILKGGFSGHLNSSAFANTTKRIDSSGCELTT
jgi:type I restriction enzyme, S subunit